VVNPDNVPGKVTLISRYGADKIEKFLPAHIEAVKATRHVVVWQCDAMVSTFGVKHMERETDGSPPDTARKVSISVHLHLLSQPPS
jgi:3-deoxy-D-arabino-heptulosonate 7-phosphate (DAHP) synthase class II